MTRLIDPEEIKRSIEKFKEEHIKYKPDCLYDVSEIDGLDGVNMISKTINKILKDTEKDTELYIICEMAKAYVDGAKPVYRAKRYKPVTLVKEKYKINAVYDECEMLYYLNTITRESLIECGWKEEEATT